MKESQPRVLVGAPTASAYNYCLKEWASGVKELTYNNFTPILVDNSKEEGYPKKIENQGIKAIRFPNYIEDSRERLAQSRNVLRDITLKEGYDYFLSLEQDVIPPKDIIEKLIAHDKKVITGVYFKPMIITFAHKGETIKKVKQLKPLLCGLIPESKKKMHLLSVEEVIKPQLIRARFAGLGCILVHRDVLEKIKFRSNKEIFCHDDVWFSNDVFNNNFEMYADTSVKCKHLIHKKPKGLFKDCEKEFNPVI